MDLYKITDKVYQENPSLEGRQSKGHKYALGSNIFDIFPEIFHDKKPSTGDYVQILALKSNQRCLKWVKRDYIKLPENFEYYRVFIPKVNGSGTLGEILSSPMVVEPNIGHSATFLCIGKFDSKNSATNVLKYIKTKFARLMLGTLKVTHDNPKNTWANVPMQEFTSKSDIDWSKSIAEIDQQLYKKYSLTNEEIDFIETNVKPME